MTADHVLVARLDNIGDVLLTGPAVRAVAARSRGVTFLAGPRGAEAARLLPGVDDVVVFDAPWEGCEPPPVDAHRIRSIVERIAGIGVGRALLFTSSHQSALPLALLLRLAGVGWIGAYSHDAPGALLDVRLRSPGDVHEVERAVALAAAAGYRLPPGDDVTLRVRRRGLAARLPEGAVVVHPGASVPARCLPAATARELVARLARAGRPVVVTGTGRDRDLVDGVTSGIPRVLALAGRTGLAQLAAVLAAATVVVAGNTGVAHLAAAVATPVVSVFAPVVPAARWRPWGVPHVLLGDQHVECAGCRARVCPVDGQPCLEPVTAPALEQAVDTLCVPQGVRRAS